MYHICAIALQRNVTVKTLLVLAMGGQNDIQVGECLVGPQHVQQVPQN